MKDTELTSRLFTLLREQSGVSRSYARMTGTDSARAARLAARIRDHMHPVAHVAALVTHSKNPDTGGDSDVGMSGTGSTAVVGLRGGASIGGTVGSIVPGIGTAIGAAVGAVVGAVAGLIAHQGSKPQRAAAAAQLLQQLRQLPADTSGRLLDIGKLGAPGAFLMMFQALYLAGRFCNDQGSKLLDHPSSMDKMSLGIIETARRAMQGILSTPPGTSINIKFRGADRDYGSWSFVNPGTDIGPVGIATRVFQPMLQAALQQGDFPGGAVTNSRNPDWLHVAALLADRLMFEIAPPSLSQQIATAPAVAMPGQYVQLGTQYASGVQYPPTTMVVSPSYPQYAGQVTPPPSTLVPLTSVSPGTGANLTPVQDSSAAFLQWQMAQQGVPAYSPSGAQLAQDIASGGVTATPQGPPVAKAGIGADLGSWGLPVLGLLLAGGIVMSVRK
jgi:hypothetical protein